MTGTKPQDPFASFATQATTAVTNSLNGVNVKSPTPDPFVSFARDAAGAVNASLTPAEAPKAAPTTLTGKLWAGAQSGGMAVASVTAKALQPLFVTKDWTDALVLAGQAALEPDPAKKAALTEEVRGRLLAARGHLTWGAVSRVDGEVKAQTDRMVGSKIMQQAGVDGEFAGFMWDVLADPGLLLTGGAGLTKLAAGGTRATAAALRSEAAAARSAGNAARAANLEAQAARVEGVAARVGQAGNALLRAGDAVDTAPVRAVTRVAGRVADEVVAGVSKLPAMPTVANAKAFGQNGGLVAGAVGSAFTKALSAPVQANPVGRVIAGLAGRGDAVDYGVANLPGGRLPMDVIRSPEVQRLLNDRSAKLDANMAGEQVRARLNEAAASGTQALNDLVKAGVTATKKGLLEPASPPLTGKAPPQKALVSQAVTTPVTRLLQSTTEADALRAVQEIRDLSARTGIPETKFLDAARGVARADHALGTTLEGLGLARNVTSEAAAGLFASARTLDDLVPAFKADVIPKTRVGELGVPVLVRVGDADEVGYVTAVNKLDDDGKGTLTVTTRDSVKTVPDEDVRINELASDAPVGANVRQYASTWTANGLEGPVIPGERARGYLMRMYQSLEGFGQTAERYRARGRPDVAVVTDTDRLAETLATVQRSLNGTPAPAAPVLPGMNAARQVPTDPSGMAGGKLGTAALLPPGPLNDAARTTTPPDLNAAAPLKPELNATPTNVRDTRGLANALVTNTKGNVDDAAQLTAILTAGKSATEKLAKGGYAASTVQRLERQERRVGHVTGGLNRVQDGAGTFVDMGSALNRADTSSLEAGVNRAVARDPEVWAGGLPFDEALTRVAQEFLPYARSADEAFDWGTDAFNTQLSSGRLDIDPATGLTYNLRADRWAGTEASYRAGSAERKAAMQARLTAMGVHGKAAWAKQTRGRWARQVKRLNGRLPSRAEVKAYDKLLAEHTQRMAVRTADPRVMAGELADFWRANPNSTAFDGVEHLFRTYGGLPDDVAALLAFAIHRSEGFHWTAGDARLADVVEFFGGKRRLGEVMRPGGSNRSLFRVGTQEQFSWFQKDVARQALEAVDDASTIYIRQVQSRVGRLSFAHNMQMFSAGLTRRGELVDGQVADAARLKWSKASAGGARLEDVLRDGEWRGVTFSAEELAHLERFGGGMRVYHTTDEVRGAAFDSGWVRVDGRMSNLTGGTLREGDYVTNQAFAHLMVASRVPDVDVQAKLLWGWWRREERLVTSAWLSSTTSAMNEFLGSTLIPVLAGRLSPAQLGRGFKAALAHRRLVDAGDEGARRLDLLMEQQGVKGSQALLVGNVSDTHLRDLGRALGLSERELPGVVEAFLRYRETRAGLRNIDRGVRQGLDYANVMASVQRASGLGFTGTRASLFKFREGVTDLVREAALHAYLEKGLSPLEAAQETGKLLGDMRALPLWAAAMGRVPLMGPFMAWTQHASALTLITLMTRPQGVITMARLPMAQDAHQEGQDGNVTGERLAMRAQFRTGVRLGSGGWNGAGQYLNLGSYNFADTIPNMLSGFSSETAGPIDFGGQFSLLRAVWTGQQKGGYNVYSGVLGFGKAGGFVEAFRADPQAATAVAFQTLASGTRSNLEFGGRQAQSYARTIVGLSQLPDDGSAAWSYAHGLMGTPSGRLFVASLYAGPSALTEWVLTGSTDALLPVTSTSLEGTPPQSVGTGLARLAFPIQEVQGDPREQGAAARLVKEELDRVAALDGQIRRKLQWADEATQARLYQQREQLAAAVRERLSLLDR